MADPNWIGWDDITPLDAGAQGQFDDVVGWLRAVGAKSAGEMR